MIALQDFLVRAKALSVFGKPYLCSSLEPVNRTDAKKTGMDGSGAR